MSVYIKLLKYSEGYVTVCVRFTHRPLSGISEMVTCGSSQIQKKVVFYGNNDLADWILGCFPTCIVRDHTLQLHLKQYEEMLKLTNEYIREKSFDDAQDRSSTSKIIAKYLLKATQELEANKENIRKLRVDLMNERYKAQCNEAFIKLLSDDFRINQLLYEFRDSLSLL